jgi:hypothetical protein
MAGSKRVKICFAFIIMFLSWTVFSQARPQLFRLGGPNGARFAITDPQWPANHGDASACMWPDDKLSAVTIGNDDNLPGDVPYWNHVDSLYGLVHTWWLETLYIGSSMKGTWNLWRTEFAMGNDCESHTVTHASSIMHTQYGYTWDMDYGLSQKKLRDSIPGNGCYTIAYPGGDIPNDPAIAAKYFIAMRGGAGTPSQANSINMLSVNSIYDPTDSNIIVSTINKTTTYQGGNFYRGYNVLWLHGVTDGATTSYQQNKASLIPVWTCIQRHNSVVWPCGFSEGVRYNAEYATNKLTKLEASDSLVRYTLSDSMADSIYTYPLTIKVRLNSNWQTMVHATQNGKAIACSTLTYSGSLYALIKAVPDKGEIRLTKSATGVRNIPSLVRIRNEQGPTRAYDLRGRAIVSQVENSHGIYLIANVKHNILNKKCVIREY